MADPRRNVYPLTVSYVAGLALILGLYVLTTDAGRPGGAVLPSPAFTLWMFILVLMLAVSAGIVFAHALISYVQLRSPEDLILSLVAANIVVMTFVFFLTHYAFEGLSPLASRDRFRVVVWLMGLSTVTGLFAVSLRGQRRWIKILRLVAAVTGCLVAPMLMIAVFVSPVLPFLVVVPGTNDVTPLGSVMLAYILWMTVSTLVIFSVRWVWVHRSTDLAAAMMLSFWLVGMMIFSNQQAKYEYGGLLWISSLLFGLAILALAVVVRAVFETRTTLEEIIQERTRELTRSRQESDFYLRMWAHEVGNLLQGLVVYLELLSERGGADETMLESARMLVEKSALVNRQVEILGRVKQSPGDVLRPVGLISTLAAAIESAKGTTYDSVRIVLDDRTCRRPMVLADDLLELMFVSFMVFAARYSSNKNPDVHLDVSMSGDLVYVNLAFAAYRIPSEIETSLTSDEVSWNTALGLDLSVVKLLAERYGAHVRYSYQEEQGWNVITLVFPCAPCSPGDTADTV
ncbi:MAG: hypothetical protein QXS20_04735 [Candidatus Thorarchaeota archaeon]